MDINRTNSEAYQQLKEIEGSVEKNRGGLTTKVLDLLIKFFGPDAKLSEIVQLLKTKK